MISLLAVRRLEVNLLFFNDQTCAYNLPPAQPFTGKTGVLLFSYPNSYAAENRGNVITYKKGEKSTSDIFYIYTQMFCLSFLF